MLKSIQTVRITLDNFLDKLKTGDIIFSRSETWTGKIIQLSGRSIFNHVAMCIVKNEKRYWCEATNMHSVDNGVSGVKVWEIYEILKKMLIPNNPKDKSLAFLFGVTSLVLDQTKEIKPIEDQIQKAQNSLISFFEKEKGKPYEDSYVVLFFSWFDGFQSLFNTCFSKPMKIRRTENDKQPLWAMNKQDTSRYFCSELIVEALIDSNIMKRKIVFGERMFDQPIQMGLPSSEWTVADLTDVENLNNYLNNNLKYTEIVYYEVYLEV